MQFKSHLLICDSFPFGFQITAILAKNPCECKICILLVYSSHSPLLSSSGGKSKQHILPPFCCYYLLYYYAFRILFSKFAVLLSNSVLLSCVSSHFGLRTLKLLFHMYSSLVRITSIWFTLIRLKIIIKLIFLLGVRIDRKLEINRELLEKRTSNKFCPTWTLMTNVILQLVLKEKMWWVLPLLHISLHSQHAQTHGHQTNPNENEVDVACRLLEVAHLSALQLIICNSIRLKYLPIILKEIYMY